MAGPRPDIGPFEAGVVVPPTRSADAAGLTAASRRWGNRLIVTGGVLSALNGAAHLLLPLYLPWGDHVEGLYPPVSWALYATTVFFGVLLTLAGVLVSVVARADDVPSRVVTWVVAGLAGFWAVGAGYELVVPFPAPVAAWVLPLFSVVVALLLVVGLWLRRPASTADDPGR